MDQRFASFRCLLILSCGDVERNPGPPPESAPRSEVLRRFTRCIQSELVKLIYNANNHDLPTRLYEKDPPGWNKFDKDTKFENICNIQKGGSQTFDKLVKLFKKDVRPIPRDILDVIVCYEKLRDSKRNSDETKNWKIALETYVSQNKSIKNKQAVIDNLDDNLLIEVLKKAAEKAKQGTIGSTDDGVNNVIVAIEQVLDAMEHNTNQTVEKSKSAGKKRQATETVTKIQQVKRNKCFSGVKGKKKSKVEPGSSTKDSPGGQSNMTMLCTPISEPPVPECLSDMIVPEIAQYQPVSIQQVKGKGKKRLSQSQFKETGVKGKKKLKDSSGNQFNMVTNIQISPLYSKPSYRLPHTEPPHVEPQQFEPQPFETQQMEPQQFEPGQFETQWMEPQHFEQQQMEPQQTELQVESQVEPLPFPPSPYCDGIPYSEDSDSDLQGGSTRNVPIVQDTSDMYRTLPIQEDSIDCLSESSLEDEALKSMPLQDVIRKYPY